MAKRKTNFEDTDEQIPLEAQRFIMEQIQLAAKLNTHHDNNVTLIKDFIHPAGGRLKKAGTVLTVSNELEKELRKNKYIK